MKQIICDSNPISMSGSVKTETADVPENGLVAQFFVFLGDEFLGWDCFNKERVTAGSSTAADLVLSGDNVADIQAAFRFNGKQVIVSDEDHGRGLLVNGKPVTTSRLLGPFDAVTIGPYDLKIKLKTPVDRCSDMEISAFSGPTAESVVSVLDLAQGCAAGELTPMEDPIEKETQPEEDRANGNRYNVIFNGKTVDGYQCEDVKRHLGALLKTDQAKIDRLFSGRTSLNRPGPFANWKALAGIAISNLQMRQATGQKWKPIGSQRPKWCTRSPQVKPSHRISLDKSLAFLTKVTGNGRFVGAKNRCPNISMKRMRTKMTKIWWHRFA